MAFEELGKRQKKTDLKTLDEGYNLKQGNFFSRYCLYQQAAGYDQLLFDVTCTYVSTSPSELKLFFSG